MKGDLDDQSVEMLYSAFLQLETADECRAFLEDLCTITELRSLAQRLDVAGLLQKCHTYSEISEQTGASTATISRVNRSLIYGAGGYPLILERLTAAGDKDDNGTIK